MTKLALILILVPITLRHVHHHWCTRNVSRKIKKRGLTSVITWFLCYVVLLAGVIFRAYGFTCNDMNWYVWFGYALLWIAVVGRMTSIHQLGKAFDEFIDIKPEQKLIDTGIFAYIRHPLHYFLILEMGAMAWVIEDVWSWCVLGFAFVILILREKEEEKALVQAFGDSYRAYRKRAWALVDILPKKYK